MTAAFMSARVRQVVSRAGGSLPEHLVFARLRVVCGEEWARDAIHYALVDDVVYRPYQDGADALILPVDAPARQVAA
jgi:hypothetical protein